jgi:thioredoxin 1
MSASTLELTAGNFDETIAGHDIVLVDWWAEWCGPCRMFGPIFEDAATKHPDIVFGKVDTEAEQQLSAAAGIRSIPNLMVFREGVLLFNQAGALPAHALEDLIAQVRQIDMTEVHRQIAEQQPKG